MPAVEFTQEHISTIVSTLGVYDSGTSYPDGTNPIDLFAKSFGLDPEDYPAALETFRAAKVFVERQQPGDGADAVMTVDQKDNALLTIDTIILQLQGQIAPLDEAEPAAAAAAGGPATVATMSHPLDGNDAGGFGDQGPSHSTPAGGAPAPSAPLPNDTMPMGWKDAAAVGAWGLPADGSAYYHGEGPYRYGDQTMLAGGRSGDTAGRAAVEPAAKPVAESVDAPLSRRQRMAAAWSFVANGVAGLFLRGSDPSSRRRTTAGYEPVSDSSAGGDDDASFASGRGASQQGRASRWSRAAILASAKQFFGALWNENRRFFGYAMIAAAVAITMGVLVLSPLGMGAVGFYAACVSVGVAAFITFAVMDRFQVNPELNKEGTNQQVGSFVKDHPTTKWNRTVFLTVAAMLLAAALSLVLVHGGVPLALAGLSVGAWKGLVALSFASFTLGARILTHLMVNKPRNNWRNKLAYAGQSVLAVILMAPVLFVLAAPGAAALALMKGIPMAYNALQSLAIGTGIATALASGFALMGAGFKSLSAYFAETFPNLSMALNVLGGLAYAAVIAVPTALVLLFKNVTGQVAAAQGAIGHADQTAHAIAGAHHMPASMEPGIAAQVTAQANAGIDAARVGVTEAVTQFAGFTGAGLAVTGIFAGAIAGSPDALAAVGKKVEAVRASMKPIDGDGSEDDAAVLVTGLGADSQ